MITNVAVTGAEGRDPRTTALSAVAAVAPVPRAADPSYEAVARRGDRPLTESGSSPGTGGDARPAPHEPVSTQSVLALRMSGRPVASIADAYGLSVDAVRALLAKGSGSDS